MRFCTTILGSLDMHDLLNCLTTVEEGSDPAPVV